MVGGIWWSRILSVPLCNNNGVVLSWGFDEVHRRGYTPTCFIVGVYFPPSYRLVDRMWWT